VPFFVSNVLCAALVSFGIGLVLKTDGLILSVLRASLAFSWATIHV
jgi:hypothetical protein